MLRQLTRRKRSRFAAGRSSRRPQFETLETRQMLSGLPYGANEQDTGEFMLGDVVVTVVLFESDGSKDPNLENWNTLARDAQGNVLFGADGRTISTDGPNRIEDLKDSVREGLAWWEDTLANFGSWQDTPTPAPVHSLNFIPDFQWTHNPVQTGYEPIYRESNDFYLWVEDFLSQSGFSTPASRDNDMRAFNNAQRVKYGADWAYTIFVANDHNDLDGRFAQGGDFQRAFAYAGGRFFVTPAQRPGSTFAHETGHMFWARDEYEGAGHYADQRGYYRTENSNAWDNPEPGFVQQDSIMDGGLEYDHAWQRHVSSESSLAMIGWQDSDADGVFDVLDVPLTLSGSGYYDSEHGNYRFIGHSHVQTLLNRNPSGLQNDITINEVSMAEYSTDGGTTWTLAASYGLDEVDLDLTIPVDSGAEILIRTRSVDPGTGLTVATSESVFEGSTALPTSADDPGIQGFVWNDTDGDGVWDVGEVGIPGWTMQLVDPQGTPIDLSQVLEPDDYAFQQTVNQVLDGVSVSAVGWEVLDGDVVVLSSPVTSTGQHVFGVEFWDSQQGWAADWTNEWTSAGRMLSIEFQSPVTALSIDAVAASTAGYGQLEIYDTSGKLLDRYTTRLLAGYDVETMMLRRSQPDIAKVIVRGAMSTSVRLDNLRIGPDALAVTDSLGAYALPSLPPGVYHVMATAPGRWMVTQPSSAVREVTVLPDGQMQWEAGLDRPSDFAGQIDPNTLPWQNPWNRLDVDDSGSVTPLDALLIINELNRAGGPHELVPPTDGQVPPLFLDVAGDDYVTPLDALHVINYLNLVASLGASSASVGSAGGQVSGASEGEPQSGNLPQQQAVLAGEYQSFDSSPSGRGLSALQPLVTSWIGLQTPGWTSGHVRRKPLYRVENRQPVDILDAAITGLELGRVFVGDGRLPVEPTAIPRSTSIRQDLLPVPGFDKRDTGPDRSGDLDQTANEAQSVPGRVWDEAFWNEALDAAPLESILNQIVDGSGARTDNGSIDEKTDGKKSDRLGDPDTYRAGSTGMM